MTLQPRRRLRSLAEIQEDESQQAAKKRRLQQQSHGDSERSEEDANGSRAEIATTSDNPAATVAAKRGNDDSVAEASSLDERVKPASRPSPPDPSTLRSTNLLSFFSKVAPGSRPTPPAAPVVENKPAVDEKKGAAAEAIPAVVSADKALVAPAAGRDQVRSTAGPMGKSKQLAGEDDEDLKKEEEEEEGEEEDAESSKDSDREEEDEEEEEEDVESAASGALRNAETDASARGAAMEKKTLSKKKAKRRDADEDEAISDDDDGGGGSGDVGAGAAVGQLKTDNSLYHGDRDYDPLGAATWKRGEPVPYLFLARVFDRLETSPKRLDKITLISDYFRTVIATSPSQLLPSVYLCINELAPAFEGLETGVGTQTLMKAVAEATGSTLAKVQERVKRVGDLGVVASESRQLQRTMFAPAPLTVGSVYKMMRELATTEGANSQTKKKDIIKRMLVACRECETKFIVRSLQGNLRIGLKQSTVIKALTLAVVLTPPGRDGAPPAVLDARKATPRLELERTYDRATALVKEIYTHVPSHDIVVPALLRVHYTDLPAHCRLTPGVPIKVMLGRPSKGFAEIYARWGQRKFSVEFKYDGERAQIHFTEEGKVLVYSRNSENNTQKYPDVAAFLPASFDASTVKSFILDCEIVAFDKTQGRVLPFQTLSTRKRKAAGAEDVSVQVAVFAFDLILLNGESLMALPFVKRREILHATFREREAQFYFARFKDTTDQQELAAFLKEAMASGCEGLMVKALEEGAAYLPDKREWFKIKKDYVEGITDTVDLVPIGAWYGKGKRTGVYGAYLLACYDAESEEYQSICKIGTGFSDEMLQKLAAYFTQDKVLASPPSYFRFSPRLKPEVFFEPCQVWEIQAADLSLSPVHLAAIGRVSDSKGISLRFPRLLRVREDKSPEDATSAEQITEMFNNQAVKASA